MILPTAEALEQRRRGYQRRGVVCGVAAVLMLLSALLPHVAVADFHAYGRSLIPASRFFIKAQADAPAFAGADLTGVAAGLNITYVGLAAHEVGLLMALFSTWALAAETLGLWIRRILLMSGWFLALSAVVSVTGYQLLTAAGVPTLLGSAWAFALLGGLVMILGGMEARKRVDQTTYIAAVEWNG
ncbi:hypothetical protein [uncultured Friedmanniella sp.]|uniref:hypothetical protein n=1 Tax=uncultured Friedmanniella sp. TaxID=335381 RepID=UPI0035CC1456